MLASHESLALEVRVVLLGERCTLKDGQNSVRKVVDTTGTVVASYDYDAWGNTLSDPNAIDVLFHHRAFGEVHDPDLGMTYLRARWMDPGTGRFESRDPVAGRREDPKSLQPYAYAHLDPNLLADPTGQFTLVQMLVTVGVAAIFTAIPIPALAQTRDKANHAADLARRLSRAKGHPLGGVCCKNGELSPCFTRQVSEIHCELGTCYLQHENDHIRYMKRAGMSCKQGSRQIPDGESPVYPENFDFWKSEEQAFQVSLPCVSDKLSEWRERMRKEPDGYYETSRKAHDCVGTCTWEKWFHEGGWKDSADYKDLRSVGD